MAGQILSTFPTGKGRREWLSLAAAHTTDRSVLFDWMHEEREAVKEPVLTVPEPDSFTADTNEPAGIQAEPHTLTETDETVPPETPSATEKTAEAEPESKPETEPETPPPPEKMSYTEWIKYLASHKPPSTSAPRDKTMELINRFLEKQPKIKPKPGSSTQPLPEVEKSIREHSGLMTETLASLYEKQGKYDKAIKAYEILKLKYPEKNRYFASKIAQLRTLLNKK